MPTLNWPLTGPVVVADERRGSHLVVNRSTGAWCVANRSAIEMVPGSDAESFSGPRALQAVLDPRQPSQPGHGSDDQLFVIYKLTDSCNYHCTYCYDHKIARRKNTSDRDASIREVLDRTLTQPGSRLNLLFHGGEPLLEFPEIQSIVRDYRARYQGRISFSIQTNLSLLTDDMLEFLVSYDIGLSVSVDGTTPDSNRLRVVGGQRDPYELLLAKSSKQSALRRNHIGLLVTVGDHNAGQIPEMLLRMQGDGFRSVSFSLMQQATKAAIPASVESLVRMYLTIASFAASGALSDLAVWSLIEWIRRLVHGRSSLVCMGSPCGAGRTLITVFPSGEIGPCDSIFDDRYFARTLGAYLERLNGDPLMQDLTGRNINNVEPCKTCDVLPLCNGTCPGSVILEHGSLQGVAALECAFQYRWIRELAWLLSVPATGGSLLKYAATHTMAREEMLRTEEQGVGHA